MTNKATFQNMQCQLTPSPTALAALMERVETPAPRARGTRRWAYAAAAACALLALVAIPVLRAEKPAPKLHSYVEVGSGDAANTTEMGGAYNYGVSAGGTGSANVTVDEGGTRGEPVGDQDALMTEAELRQMMSGRGFSQEDMDEIIDRGMGLTWVGWWMFNDLRSPSTLEAFEDYYAELNERFKADCFAKPANGEVIPGGALAPEVAQDPASQEKANRAYQNLMNAFGGVIPDWYGGAYIMGNDMLIVNVTEQYVPAEYIVDVQGDPMVDKSFYLYIMELCDEKFVGFGETKYSLNELKALIAKIETLPELQALDSWSCGISEMKGVVTLEVPEVSDALLAALARLDPEDDAIVLSKGGPIVTDAELEIMPALRLGSEDR